MYFYFAIYIYIGDSEVNALVGNQISDDFVDIKAETINALNIKAGSVDAENITGTTITGKTIVGGNIISNTNINVTSDVTIGDHLYLSPTNAGGGIVWNGVGEIYIDPGAKTLVVAGQNYTQIGSYSGNTIIRGNVTFPDSSPGFIAKFG